MKRYTDAADGQFMSETSDGEYCKYADAKLVVEALCDALLLVRDALDCPPDCSTLHWIKTLNETGELKLK